MFTLVGLGNPGRHYEGTRHNVGFQVVDLLLQRHDGCLRPGAGDYLFAEVEVEGRRVWLVKPCTYVNDTGRALLQLFSRGHMELEELLVLCDDVNLPLGTIRLRRRGSDGGHHGLASIIYSLGSTEFPRLRIGIGSPPNGDLVSFVLGKFEPEEAEVIAEAMKKAVRAVECFLAEGCETAMNRFNG